MAKSAWASMLERAQKLARQVRRRKPQQSRSTRRSWGRESWHGDGVVLFPPSRELFDRDLGEVIREHALVGHIPPEPMLGVDDSVVAIGSCFAGELRKYLRLAGFDSKRIWVPEGLNNTYALLDFLTWSVTGRATAGGFRYDRDANGKIREWLPNEPPSRYAERLAEAGALVFTIGVAEVWQDKETGGVFWHGVPRQVYDANRHVHRLTTVEENAANIRRIIDFVRRVNPAAPIVLTLSPVPLKGTFRGIASLSADCVSKSVLRVAIDQVIADGRESVYYWPSFEIVKWAGPNLSWPAYGLDDGKTRHVTRRLVAAIIDAFVETFFVPEAIETIHARAGSSSRAA
jgi:GSCFA family